MIEFVSKLPCKPMSCQQFHELISSHTGLIQFPESLMTQISQGYLLYDKDVIAYHLVSSSITDIIYQESSHQVFLSFDQCSIHDHFDLLDTLMKHELFLNDGSFKITDSFHLAENHHQIDCSVLPVLKISDQIMSDTNIMKCASQLKGMVHVVKCSHLNSAEALLYNHQTLRFTKSRHENDDEFVHRVISSLKDVMTKRVFELPFDMNGLYQKVFAHLIEQTKLKENELLETVDEQLHALELEKQNLIAQIESLAWQSDVLTQQVDLLKQRISANHMLPVLFKGSIEEKYPGEQKDIILSVIRDVLKTERHSEMSDLLQELIKENPEVGNRRKLMDNINRILQAKTEIDENSFTELRRFGIELKRKSRKHLGACFFQDSRYKVTISSSPSDIHAGDQVFRDLRRYYF